ncbi:hypothetical protein PQR66_27395 [Paraburkholderia agricolaris]|uniref:Uncharacterized protein n=1 Tax=Paraburkholderia agricolaris TaxID=2152888 RepID=A0ABW8ZUB7_9BURK
MRRLIAKLLHRSPPSHAEQLAGRDCRRLIKRIDETRELVELLAAQAPDLLRTHPWVLLWLEDNDSFLVELAEAIGEPPLTTGSCHRAGIWLRAWPLQPLPARRTNPDHIESEPIGAK